MGAPVSDEEANWKLVQAYIELDTAWHAKTAEIYRSDDPDEEKDRRLEEEASENPDLPYRPRWPHHETRTRFPYLDHRLAAIQRIAARRSGRMRGKRPLGKV